MTIIREAPELYSGEINDLEEGEKDLGACLVTPFEGLEEVSWIEEIKDVFKQFLNSEVFEEMEEQMMYWHYNFNFIIYDNLI